MCDKLMFKVGDVEYEKVWAATNEADALELFSYRVHLTPGTVIELADGTRAVVLENNPKKGMLVCGTPTVGDKYDYGSEVMIAPYALVRVPNCGEPTDFEDILRAEGTKIVHRCIAKKMWQDAADTLDSLRFISVDISEFAGDLADIYAGIVSDEEKQQDVKALLESLKGDA